LMALDARMLTDIGLSREAIERRAMRETTRAAERPRLPIDRPGEQEEQVFPWSGCCP
jgi:hypothetical protein